MHWADFVCGGEKIGMENVNVNICSIHIMSYVGLFFISSATRLFYNGFLSTSEISVYVRFMYR